MTYPVALKVDRPEKLSRLTTFFRGFMVIPQIIVFAFVSIAAAVMYVLSWFAILFTARYPQTFFNFLTWWFRWSVRLGGYVLLLTDKYPPFTGAVDTSYPVAVSVETPGKLSRLTTFFRFPVQPSLAYDYVLGHWKLTWSGGSGWPMTIPHSIVLFFLGIAAGVVLFLTWWAILFTGRYPTVFFDFVTRYFRWSTRVQGYAYYFTDKYPPFSGKEQA
ncbi:MAG: DUF4389 domain-containing protein [Chloroflexota bacterium]